MHLSTGYFARATEHKHRAAVSRYQHFYDSETGKCLCGYKPHPTMQFQRCAGWAYEQYCNCPKCRSALEKMKEKSCVGCNKYLLRQA